MKVKVLSDIFGKEIFNIFNWCLSGTNLVDLESSWKENTSDLLMTTKTVGYESFFNFNK